MEFGNQKIVAFIPARSGSKRIPHKNILELGGHPLIAYTITAALKSKVFHAILFITDSAEYAEIARCYGIEEVYPQEANDTKSEYDSYIRWLLETLKEEGRNFDCFSILRPTSPFRQAATIKRAWAEFLMNQPCDSLRAMEICKQHPCKMYRISVFQAYPVINENGEDYLKKVPYRDCQFQSLPEIWVQNGSLEIAWTQTVFDYHSFSGNKIYPFRTKKWEGFDINRPEDLVVANWLIDTGQAQLPIIGEIEFA